MLLKFFCHAWIVTALNCNCFKFRYTVLLPVTALFSSLLHSEMLASLCLYISFPFINFLHHCFVMIALSWTLPYSKIKVCLLVVVHYMRSCITLESKNSFHFTKTQKRMTRHRWNSAGGSYSFSVSLWYTCTLLLFWQLMINQLAQFTLLHWTC